ncbi:MAG: amino acid adenylation domain-containing protein, partial [Bacteroidales bacterium]|nr:amino acid adenylation domain-containing protein [Bacteroidales bacterium]
MKIKKENVQSIHKLTSMQQGMMLIYLSNPLDTTYFEQICLKINGLYKEEIIKNTWMHIVDQYDILRTVFRWNGLEEPIQIILHNNEPEIHFYRLQNDNNIEPFLLKILGEDLHEGMDLEKVPFRVTVVRESKDIYYMLISHHHILYDGWSNSLLINNFYDIYSALINDKEITVSNQTDTSIYFDYLKNYSTENSNAHWKDYLKNYHAFSLTKKLSEDVEISVNIEKKLFEKDESETIKRFCKDNGITPAALLFAVLGLCLQKSLNCADIMIGTTVSGRNLPIRAIDQMVGLFIQTIPLRFQNYTEKSLLDFVRQVNIDIINSSGNEIYSIADIKRHLGVPVEKELFEVIAVAENYPIDTRKLSSQEDFQIQYHMSYDKKSAAPLCVEFRLLEDIEVYFKYKKNIVSGTIIADILSSYPEILQQILRYPYGSVNKLIAIGNADVELNSTGICMSQQVAVRVKDNETINRLKVIWADILEIPMETISDDANFFDLGGHSLKLTYLILRLQKEFEVGPIKVSYIYKIPTIKLMADFVCLQKQKHIPIPKQPLKAYYKVSPAQKSFYMFQKLYPISVHYNMISAYVINGFLEMDKLENALELLLDKHESLRTTFLTEDGEVFQRIHKYIETPLFYLSSEGKKEDKIIQDFIAPFDLSTAPLLKVGVAQIDSDRSMLVFQLHHIISDGISNQILIQDLVDAYSGSFGKEQSITYKDFSVWKSLHDRSKQKQYWEGRLQDNVFQTNIIPSCTNNGQQGWQGRTIHFELDKCKHKELKDLTMRENVSLYSLLLSCWVILLHKLSNQTYITTGTVTSGRTHPDIEETVGLFISSLPFSVKISDDQSFHEFLLNVHEMFINDMDNQDYELGEIVNDLHLNRNPNENPLFNTMFVLQNMKQTEFKLPGLSIKEFTSFQKYTKYDLTLFVTPEQDVLLFDMEFRVDLFNESLVRLFSQYYVAILDKVIGDTELPLHDISILLPEQKQYILHEWNSPVSKLEDKTVQALFKNQVLLNPGKIAVVDGNNRFTYAELNILANKIAYFLRTHNVKQGDTVAVYMDNSVTLIAGLLGILKIGAVYLPVDIETPSKRLSYILEDSGCQHILVLGDRVSPIEGLSTINVWNIKKLMDMDENVEDILVGSADDTMYIIYTSGTTGVPKGCLVQQKSVVNYLEWAISQYYKTDEASTFAFFSSPAFDLSVTSLFSPLICGQTIAIYRRKLDALYQVLSDNLCNIIKVTPTQLRLIVSKNCSASKIKTIILGGEQFTVELAEKATKAFGADIRLYNEYGPTEATVGCMIHQYDPKIDTGHAVSIGVPAANMQIYVLDGNMEICPVGVKGEIFIAGIGISPGYLKQPELSQCVFIEHAFEGETPQRLYKTGDVGILSENGLLYYSGRLDGQIKIHGYRIETEEVQKAILQVEKITDVFVLTEQGKSGDQFLSAYYVSKGTTDVQEIKSSLAEMLPHYMIPDYFYQVDIIPTTLSGKIDTKQLLSFKTNKKSKKNRQKTTSGTIAFLHRLWMEYLDVEEVELDDNFFDVGGNSYILLKMHEELSEAYPQVEITDFFKYPTIQSFAQFIDRNNVGSSNITAAEVQTTAERSDSIAVIGIGLHLHDAKSLWELKDVFANKTDCVRDLPTNRKNDLVQYLSYLGIQEESYEISEAAFLDRIDTFDYKFFKITKSEAELTDPYHRILLETAHHAFEDSGYKKEDIQGSNTGVYIGQPHSTNYYDKIKRIKPEMAVVAGPGNVDSIMAGRIAYYYDLKGPSMMVNTACSSSLSALYLACQAIRSGEIEMGLVGGVNIITDPSSNYNAPIPDIVSSTARAR